MLTPPASARLLRESYTLRPKTEAPDGQGGTTVSFDGSADTILRGTKRAIDTEETVDILGAEVGDRGSYIVWVNPAPRTPNHEDRLIAADGLVMEIKRRATQNGLMRLWLVEVV